MRKIITVALLFACFCTYGQSIKLFSVSENRWLDTDDTVTAIIPVNEKIEVGLDIVNVSDNSVELMIRRELISLLPETENLFCFLQCFESWVDVTEYPYTFSAGDTLLYSDGYFYTAYNPKNQKGISVIKYTFYDHANPSDATDVIFVFDSENMEVGIKDNISEMARLSVYPNPTTSQLRITNYELRENTEYYIYSVVGQIVQQGKLHNNIINVESLASGMYFLKVDNTVSKILKN